MKRHDFGRRSANIKQTTKNKKNLNYDRRTKIVTKMDAIEGGKQTLNRLEKYLKILVNE